MSAAPIVFAVIRTPEDVVAAAFGAPGAVHLPVPNDPIAIVTALGRAADEARAAGRPLRVLGRSRYDRGYLAEIREFETANRGQPHPCRLHPIAAWADYHPHAPLDPVGVLAGLGLGEFTEGEALDLTPDEVHVARGLGLRPDFLADHADSLAAMFAGAQAAMDTGAEAAGSLAGSTWLHTAWIPRRTS